MAVDEYNSVFIVFTVFIVFILCFWTDCVSHFIKLMLVVTTAACKSEYKDRINNEAADSTLF